jgi:hypothetical protein
LQQELRLLREENRGLRAALRAIAGTLQQQIAVLDDAGREQAGPGAGPSPGEEKG